MAKKVKSTVKSKKTKPAVKSTKAKPAVKSKKSFMQKFKDEFSTTALVLIPIGIAINQIGRLISTALALPVFLDTIGTVFMAMLAGPWVAGIGGFLTNVVTAIAYGRPTSVFFGTVQLFIGLVVGLFVYKGWLKKPLPVLGTGVLLAVTAAFVSSIISTLVAGGVSGSGVDVVVAVFLAAGQKYWTSMVGARIITESIDKIIAVFVPWLSVKRLPEKYARLFKYTNKIR